MEVGIRCTKQDLATIQRIMPTVLSEFEQVMKRDRELSEVPLPSVIINEDDRFMLSADQYIGGVILMADRGQIMCDNTLVARLGISTEICTPQIRATLF